ncbi:MAG TPA: acyltransferase family protein [Microvirga sp.]|jgi:peptidoglycan/LPS O-acetylase OafA/YrhL
MAVAPAGSAPLRPEIQGLRAVGALLVAVFHIWMGGVSGGVDVFFVLSGFLMTGSLYREQLRNGFIDAVGFWGRIARRIAPVAYVILLFTGVAALLWLPATRWAAFVDELLFSALHLENVRLIASAVDYLAREEAPSPVQQFWALSVQVQFYAVWPFVLMAAGLAARQTRQPWTVHVLALLAIAAASLTYSIVRTASDPAAAYFDPFARVWEFALGGLAALVAPHIHPPRSLRLVMGWVGLAAVVTCGFVLPTSAAFPGYVALWPTGGALLILLAGTTDSRFGAHRILSWRPLVAFGGISFTFYLWHWPVLVFLLILRGKTQAGFLDGLAVLALALVGAVLTSRLVERPMLASALLNGRWRPHGAGLAFAAPVVAFAAIGLVRLDHGKAPSLQWRPSAEHPGGALPVSVETALTPGVPLLLPPLQAKGDLPRSYHDACNQTQTKPEVITCTYGVKTGAAHVIALVGGSHSAHWLPPLEVLAEEYDWQIVNVIKSACVLDTSAERRPSCVEWNRDVLGVIQTINPDVVFTTSTRYRYTDPNPPQGIRRREIVPDGYLEQWARLDAMNISVIAVRDNPQLKAPAPECLEANLPDFMKCARPRRERIDEIDPTTLLQPRPRNVAFIDLTDRFCDREYCLPVAGNIIVYRDSNHITASYARTLAPALAERMRQVRPDLFTRGRKVSNASGG